MQTTNTDALIKGYIDRLETLNMSEDFIKGSLDGMSFIVEFLQMMKRLETNKNKYLREEFYVADEISN